MFKENTFNIDFMAFNLNLLFKIIQARIFEIPPSSYSLKIDIAQSVSMYIFILDICNVMYWTSSIHVNIISTSNPTKAYMVTCKGFWFVARGWLTLDMQMLKMKLPSILYTDSWKRKHFINLAYLHFLQMLYKITNL